MIKARWQIARDVAEALGIKTQLAWSMLKKLVLLDGILAEIPEAIELGYELSQDRHRFNVTLMSEADVVGQ
ncbi:hypothetical protein LCGC14_1091440 [marine sediment metagenome]|uniref:Uncharacterized protein n=1 Tax=marine sediment metagenome TaxID=412755 RepID=A0A0F9MGL5_9ZZZZ